MGKESDRTEKIDVPMTIDELALVMDVLYTFRDYDNRGHKWIEELRAKLKESPILGTLEMEYQNS